MLNFIRCCVPCPGRFLVPVHRWLGYLWPKALHWFCWFWTLMLSTHPDPLCKKGLDTHRERERISFTFIAQKGRFCEENSVQVSHLTCFQEASPVKISACLSSHKASSYHVTGGGRGHVQFKVPRDGLSATWARGGEVHQFETKTLKKYFVTHIQDKKQKTIPIHIDSSKRVTCDMSTVIKRI